MYCQESSLSPSRLMLECGVLSEQEHRQPFAPERCTGSPALWVLEKRQIDGHSGHTMPSPFLTPRKSTLPQRPLPFELTKYSSLTLSCWRRLHVVHGEDIFDSLCCCYRPGHYPWQLSTWSLSSGDRTAKHIVQHQNQ